MFSENSQKPLSYGNIEKHEISAIVIRTRCANIHAFTKCPYMSAFLYIRSSFIKNVFLLKKRTKI